MKDRVTVLGAAIKRHDLVCWLPKPARHADVIRAMARAGMDLPIGQGWHDVQGFMTSTGFYSRDRTHEILGRPALKLGSVLTSEELW